MRLSEALNRQSLDNIKTVAKLTKPKSYRKSYDRKQTRGLVFKMPDRKAMVVNDFGNTYEVKLSNGYRFTLPKSVCVIDKPFVAYIETWFVDLDRTYNYDRIEKKSNGRSVTLRDIIKSL